MTEWIEINGRFLATINGVNYQVEESINAGRWTLSRDIESNSPFQLFVHTDCESAEQAMELAESGKFGDGL